MEAYKEEKAYVGEGLPILGEIWDVKGGLLCEWQYCRSEVSRNVTSGTLSNMQEACQSLFLPAQPALGPSSPPSRPLFQGEPLLSVAKSDTGDG